MPSQRSICKIPEKERHHGTLRLDLCPSRPGDQLALSDANPDAMLPLVIDILLRLTRTVLGSRHDPLRYAAGNCRIVSSTGTAWGSLSVK